MSKTIDDIIKNPYNKIFIESLICEIKLGNVVPYIGAGMSCLEEGIYPMWSKLLEHLENLPYVSDSVTFPASLQDKASVLFREIGEEICRQEVKRVFSNSKMSEIINWDEKAVYSLPNIITNGLIITTNYDGVLERVYNKADTEIPLNSITHYSINDTEAIIKQLKSADKGHIFLLYKMHGDITAENIILSKEQYNMFYNETENPALLNFLKYVYENNSILFLGCSLNEEDGAIKFFKDHKGSLEHYAIIPEDSKDKIKKLREEYNITSIVYPKGEHEYVKIIFDYIAYKLGYKNTNIMTNITENNTPITVNTYSPKRLDKLNLKNPISLSLSEYINGKKLVKGGTYPANWNGELKERVIGFTSKLDENLKYDIYFTANYPLAFLMGYHCSEKGGVSIKPFQFISEEEGWKNFGDLRFDSNQNYQFWEKPHEIETGEEESDSHNEVFIIDAIGVEKETIKDDVLKYLKISKLSYSKVKYFKCKGDVMDGYHAMKLAKDFRRNMDISSLNHMHLFCSSPISLVFMIARKLYNVCTNITIYDHQIVDGEIYSPTFKIINGK